MRLLLKHLLYTALQAAGRPLPLMNSRGLSFLKSLFSLVLYERTVAALALALMHAETRENVGGRPLAL